MTPPVKGGKPGQIKHGNVYIDECVHSEEMEVTIQEKTTEEVTPRQENSDTSGTTEKEKDTSQKKENQFFNLQNDKYYNLQNIYVYIEKINNQNIGRLHPMYVGHILHNKLKLKNNVISVEKIGLNRVKVGVRNLKEANDLVKNSNLLAENLKAYIPNNLLYRKGLIRDVDTFFDDTYLKDNIVSNSNVLDVARLKRKVTTEDVIKFVPKQTVILTFEGNLLPNHVVINSVIFPVEPYVQRVVQCFKCLRYGHIAKQCRGAKTLCTKCGVEKDTDHSCNVTHCIFCNDNSHNTVSKSCPHYIKQQKIKKHMAISNMSFSEAKNTLDNSVSNIVSTQNRFDVFNNLKDNSVFPALPTRSNKVKTSTNLTLSQPILRQIDISKPASKKRKTYSPPAFSSQPPPMFPFVMGPAQPITMNPYRPNPDEERNKEKKEIVKSIISLFNEFYLSCQNSQKLEDSISKLEEKISSMLQNIL